MKPSDTLSMQALRPLLADVGVGDLVERAFSRSRATNMWFFKRKREWPSLSLEEIKKRSRILVIDDNEFFYLELFRNDEYSIDKWDDVEDLSKLET